MNRVQPSSSSRTQSKTNKTGQDQSSWVWLDILFNTCKKLDNDGYIDRKELGMVMKSFDQDLNELELKEMVSECVFLF